MKVLFYNILFFLIAGVFFSAAAEIFLRVDGRYADLVNENLIRSRAIWDRPVNDVQYRKHPDLDYEVEIVFNELGIRNHQGVTLADIRTYEGGIIGVFGDSMTENRRIDDEFTFTSLLDNYLRPGFRVLNLGVDGYGLDQSYLKYLDFRARSELTHVFYVFLDNDLRNIYENQLFDFSNDEIGKPLSPRINPIIEVARKFHVVYLFLDSYARLKAKIGNEAYQTGALNRKLQGKFGADKLRRARGERFHDEYADSLVKDYLTDAPSESSLEWAKRFRLLLNAWAKDAKAAGQEFVILVTPTQVSTDLARKLFGQQFADQTVYMMEYHTEGKGIVVFENDNHWNEQGNLRAASAIVDWGAAGGLWVKDTAKWAELVSKTERAIEKRYVR